MVKIGAQSASAAMTLSLPGLPFQNEIHIFAPHVFAFPPLFRSIIEIGTFPFSLEQKATEEEAVRIELVCAPAPFRLRVFPPELPVALMI